MAATAQCYMEFVHCLSCLIKILHSDGLRDLYSSQHIIWMIKLRMREAGQVTCKSTEKKINVYSIFIGKPKVKNPRGNRTLNGKIKFKCIMKKLDGTMWTRLIWLIRLYDDLYEYGNQPLVPHTGNSWTRHRPTSFSRTLLCGYCVGCGREVKATTVDPRHNIITCQS